MKVLSLFSGIGAFEKALDNIGKEYELVGFSEIDKYATKSYCAIHGVNESMNLGDITKVDEKSLPKNIDLVTYGFPCQDISLAGKQKGMFNEDGTHTRSGLFFEALRIIEETQPRVAIAENVKNLTSKKFSEQFKIVLESLEQAGYNNYWQVLNAKDYGVPQNRERVFIVSIRKDVDTGLFRFPEGFPLELRLKDLLENVVDEKFYLTNKQIEKIKNSNFTQERTRIQKNICGSLLARDYKDPKCVRVAQMYPNSGNPQVGRIYNADGISPTMDTCSGGNRMPKVLVREATKKGYAEAFDGDSINLDQPNSQTRRGRVGRQVAQTLTTSCNLAIVKDWRIRKLTPKECFRLMGFADTDFAKAEAVNSNTQLYKQAGNSIVVPVVEYIIKALFDCDVLNQENKRRKNMELKVNAVQVPEKITFNYEELKQEIEAKVSDYSTLVYTGEQIKEAKADRSNLNKLKKALNDERIRLEREYLQPFNDFKVKINEIIKIIDEPVRLIDKQIKEVEEQEKAEKRKKIEEYWNSKEKPFEIPFETILDSRWLNKSTSMASVTGAIDVMLESIEKDINTLSNLPEFGFEATEVYKTTLDINRALNEGKRLAEIQKRKEEEYRRAEEARKAAEAKKEDEQLPGQIGFTDAKSFEECMNPPETDTGKCVERQWVAFAANLTIMDAQNLANYFAVRGIEYKPATISEDSKYLISKVFQHYYNMGISEIAKEDGGARELFEEIGLI